MSATSATQYRHGHTHLERAKQALVYAHHGSSIVELSAVVGCAEQGNKLALGEEFVAVLDDLMGTADQVHVVLLQEAGNNVRTKGEGNTSVVFAPASNIFVWVRPQKVAKKTAVGDLRK